MWPFPIDEPCGTRWKRAWTTYAAGLARKAGLTTFSTRNNWDWDANLDHGAAGGMINAMYREPALVSAVYEGDLQFDALPWIGAFRSGAKYHFQGLIDDVRIYNRALTDEEVLAQHRTPAKGGLLAYFPCDGPTDNAKLIGNPKFVAGKVGRAIQLNGIDQRFEPIKPKKAADLSRGWSISLWCRGNGCPFGRGYSFYHEGRGLCYTTSAKSRAWFNFGGKFSPRFWCHLTISFDPVNQRVKAFCENTALRRWHRDNVGWNYLQVRSFPPRNARFKTGVMSWWYANHGALTNITTFCYDWNAAHLYVVYPKNGDRFANDGIWYRTLGWEGCREGIDDARYLQTLLEALQERRGLSHEQARRHVRELLAPVDGSYSSIRRVVETFGGYRQLRDRVITEIIEVSP